MKSNLSNLTFPTKLTVTGLVGCAVAIWIQWLSGDPAYPKFPPGPVFFIAVAAIVAFGARWWWTPLIGSLIALLVTSGWFARLPRQMQLLTHPGSIGHFAPGIFLGTLGMIVFLLLTDVAGLLATVLNYRTRKIRPILQRWFCALSVPFLSHGRGGDCKRTPRRPLSQPDAYRLGYAGAWSKLSGWESSEAILHQLRHLLSDAGGSRTDNRRFRHRKSVAGWTDVWHTGDHVFHLVLGTILLSFGLVSGPKGCQEACMTLDHLCGGLHFTNLLDTGRHVRT